MTARLEVVVGTREAARIAGVHENTIRNWADSGQLAVACTVGRLHWRRFYLTDVEEIGRTGRPPRPAISGYVASELTRLAERALDCSQSLRNIRRALLEAESANAAVQSRLADLARRTGAGEP